MKAALYDRTGPAGEVLRVEEVERPEPGPGEVRVKIAVSAVNPTDYKSRSGVTGRPIDGFQIPHQDGAGVIDAVGEGVPETRIGERVWLFLAAAGNRWGTAAEWSVVPARQAVPLPDGISFELGASLGVPAMTAHHCLFADGPLGGRSVLVAGGAGAVGHFAIELGRYAGARIVTTVSGPKKAELASKAGAELVVNYHDDDAVDRIRSFASPIHRIIEVNLGANLGLDLAVAGAETFIVVYAATGANPELPVRDCMSANVILRFVMLYGVAEEALDRAAAEITEALKAGALTELPVHEFGLDDIAAAHEAAEAGPVGKVILRP